MSVTLTSTSPSVRRALVAAVRRRCSQCESHYEHVTYRVLRGQGVEVIAADYLCDADRRALLSHVARDVQLVAGECARVCFA